MIPHRTLPHSFPTCALFIAALVLAGRAGAQQRRDIAWPNFSIGARSPDSTSSAQNPQDAPRAPGVYMNVGFSGLSDFGWSTEKDVRSLQRGDHDPSVRGFTMPNAELTLDGNVDPYFKGFVNIAWKIDENGESAVELEEAYFLTQSLPANLQLKGGQFFVDFGRQNAQHPHSWAFVDQPLVLNRMFGPDGLRGQGARISWLAPTSFYTEAMVSVMNAGGETMFSFGSPESTEIHGGAPVEHEVNGGTDLVFVPRLASSFDLTETQTLLLGISSAFGPNNSGPSSRTRLYGADLYWKWKSATAAQGFPFFSVQAEAMTRAYEAPQRVDVTGSGTFMLPAETLNDNGGYAQVLWGIRPRIIAGFRGEWANGDRGLFDSAIRIGRARFSPNFTYYPSEFSKVRLQYNFDDRKGIGRDHSLWLQFEFILGAHAAHRF